MPFGPIVPDYCLHGPASHQCDRRFVLIGEAPGTRESELGLPFVGKAGSKLGDWLESIGWNRAMLYITNVYPYKPASFTDDINVVPKAEIEYWSGELHRRIAQLADPWILIPLGNTALKAILSRCSDIADKKPSILNYRGSILEYADLNGRKIKVIPTIHPAAVLRMPSWEKRVRYDWLRIKEESAFREVILPKRTHIIHPKYSDIAQFADEIKARRKDGIMAVDIEIDPPTNRLLCIAFSYDPMLSITLPLEGFDSPYKSMCWTAAKAFCGSPIAKVLQNGSFDRYHLYFNAINLRNYKWDCMDLFHLLDPNEDHSLAFLASIFTKERYYKQERKEGGGGVFSYPIMLRYCGKDACITREVLDRLMEWAAREEALIA
jgi:uracil-DNA glycosylase family 4